MNGIKWVFQTLSGTDAITVIDDVGTSRVCLHFVSLSGAAASVVSLIANGGVVYQTQGGPSWIEPGHYGPCVDGPITLDQTGSGTASVTIGYTWKEP